jgi:hypothetical protein
LRSRSAAPGLAPGAALFRGFGGLFLVLSYFFRALWKMSKEESRPDE